MTIWHSTSDNNDYHVGFVGFAPRHADCAFVNKECNELFDPVGV